MIPYRSTCVMLLVALALLVPLAGVISYATVGATPPARVIDVPFLSQTAPGHSPTVPEPVTPLGNDPNVLLWEKGCGVASLAMVFNYYGVDTGVVRLNEQLRQTGGFSGALLAWSNATAFRLRQHFIKWF